MDDPAVHLQQTIGSGCVTHAEVIGPDGSVHASTGRPLTTGHEAGRLARLFETPTDAVAEGITVGGLKYVAAEANHHLLHGKRGGDGVVAVRNLPFIVVGLYGQGRRPADAVLSLEKLADLLAADTRRPAPP